MSAHWRMFKMCAEIANSRKDFRDFHLGALGIRKDGIIVMSPNSPCVINPEDRRHYAAEAHAEFKVSKKLDKGAVVYVARVNNCFEYKMARPCQTCMNALRSRGVKRVYYTINDHEYGVIEF